MMQTKEKQNYLNVSHTIKSWLLTQDHKRIAILYLVSVTLFFLVGSSLAMLMRLELLTPKGDLMQSEMYNRVFTGHGVVMVFLFLIPGLPAVFGNFLIPVMIGARDLAFPKINLASWYVFLAGGFMILAAVVFGGLDTGWTFYTPYSSSYATGRVTLGALGAFTVGFSSIMTGLNFLITIHKMRAPGMTWFRLPLFVWAHYATALIMVLSTPVVAIAIVMVALEHLFGFGFFDPTKGGDPVLFQHLFWFYSHPAVYIMILPAMGVISELIACFTRKRIFGYRIVAYSSLAIAVIGFLVWGHHLFLSTQSAFAGIVFSFITYIVAIPSAVKAFNWTATMYKSSVSWSAPMMYVIGFMGLFCIGGLTGLFCANLAVDVHIHDTYFIVAHFHYIMVGGTIMGYLGALHFWWPKMTGRMYSEAWARFSAAMVFIGFNLTFFPQFLMGYLGMPRRYHYYPEEFQFLNILSTAGALILGVGYMLPLFYLVRSLSKGPKASANPWGAKGLEWETHSPPPVFNFDKTPVVTEEAYAYEK